MISQDILSTGILVRAANKEEYASELQNVVSFYGSNVDESELHTQLEILGANMNSEKTITMKVVLTFLRNLSRAQRTFFKQVCWIARLILVSPATNATSERSFSCMKRIKSYLRSTMNQSRLNSLMTLNIYKELTEKLDVTVIANEFVKNSEHRQRVFGTF